MSGTLYWLLFGVTAAVMLIGVPAMARLERRSDARERARLERLERTEQARRRIRLGL